MRIGALFVCSLLSGAIALQAANWYVATNGPGGGATNWATATNNIQDAISLCSSGDVVWVSNGVYEVGGVTNWPAGATLTNRVAITTAYVIVRSANNDPTNTIIKGAWDPGTTNGPAAVRCVYMTNNATLIGFTLTNGATLTNGGENFQSGGGIYGASLGSIVSNCIIANNSASMNGGGAYNCTLHNSTFVGNSAGVSGGGASVGVLSNCTLSGNSAILSHGGGAFQSTLYNCTLIGNSASVHGGGTRQGTAYNSTYISNSASYGSAASESTIYNCLLTRNASATGCAYMYDFHMYNCTIVSNAAGISLNNGKVYNSIVYANTWNYSGGTLTNWVNSCTTPEITGWAAGNITNDPLFVGANNYRLSNNSPCINAGTNQAWMTGSFDLDGRSRIRYGTVDMGAYERFNEGTIYNIR